MSEWKLLGELPKLTHGLPFPRPQEKEPNLWDEMLGRDHWTKGLARFWDLLATSPVECTVKSDAILDIKKQTGVDVIGRCRKELREWYVLAIKAYLSDRLFTSEEKINLENLRMSFGFSEKLKNALHKEAFGDYLRRGIFTCLNRSETPPEKARQIKALMVGVPLPHGEIVTIRDEVFASFLLERLRVSCEMVEGHEVIEPSSASNVRMLASSLGYEIGWGDQLVGRRLLLAENLWAILRGKLPVLPTHYELEASEVCHFSTNVDVLQVKRVVTRRAYKGFSGSTKLFFGISYRSGVYDVYRETQDQLQKIDQGTLLFTSKRIIFDGGFKNFSVKYGKVIDIKEYKNGVEVVRESGGDVFFCFTNGVHLAALILRRLTRDSKK